MTEMSPIVAVQSHPDITRAPGSIGKLAPSTKAMLLDLDGNGESQKRRVACDKGADK